MAKEPTNHGGHTHEMARRHEADARVHATRERARGKEEAPGRGHEMQHRSLKGDAKEHEQSKFGASVHWRGRDGARDE
jgi:hypothetical protein